jgi:hypothetical protein
LKLTGICRRAEIDEQLALRVDHERVHGMVAGQGQAGQHHGWLPDRQRRPWGEWIAQDAAVFLRKQRVVIKRDAASASAARLDSNTKAVNDVRSSLAFGVLQG